MCAVKLLVLGGTKFLGRATVAAALARGHEVTLFNRGETNADLFPDTEKLRGDRTQDLSALDGREWDAVVDPSGYVPSVVRASAEKLSGQAGYYLFVSSLSAYADRSKPMVEGKAMEQLGSDLPIGVGLGVSHGDQAAEVASYADAVIVGSAFVRTLLDAHGDRAAGLAALRLLTEDLAAGVRRA